MQVRVPRITRILALLLVSLVLSGCGAINEKLAAGAGDFLPQWAGGMPPDVPPRRGTPQYDEYMKEQESKRLQAPGSATAGASIPATPATSLDPLH
jgi:hypothetical protein